MAGAAGGAAEDVERARLDPLPRPEQHGRVEVALDAAVVADLGPGAVELDPPVDADHVAAGRRHPGENPRRRGAEVDRGHVEGGQDAPRVRRHELVVVGRREHAHPRVEQLDHIGSRRDFRLHIGGKRVRQPRHERVPDVRLAVHQRLDREEVAARPALDEVAGRRERATTEADERLLGLKLAPHDAHRLQRPREGVFAGNAEPLDVFRRPDRMLDHRSDALDQLERDTHGGNRGHDVREHHGGVQVVPADRL